MRCRMVALALLGLVGCASPAPPRIHHGPTASATPSPALPLGVEEDRFAKLLLQDKAHCCPALPWLESRDHILWKGPRQAIWDHLREAQAAGAPEIWVCTQDLKDKQIGFAFVVVLPSIGEARARVFELHNRFWDQQTSNRHRQEVQHRLDEGQHYLLYSFD